MFVMCALALFVAGFMSVASAGVPDVDCSHHTNGAIVADDQASLDKGADLENPDCTVQKTQEQAHQDECQDCCCVHSHSFASVQAIISENPAQIAEQRSFELHVSLRSNDASPLYRPPII